MPAVTGSSSIPVTWAPPGANAMKFPLPQPGSSTRPPLEAERPDRRPHRLDERGVGVVRVQRVPPGRRQLGR